MSDDLFIAFMNSIISSPEALANTLTHWQYDENQNRGGWTNDIIVGQLYEDYREAVAVTVAKLKEVSNE